MYIISFMNYSFVVYFNLDISNAKPEDKLRMLLKQFSIIHFNIKIIQKEKLFVGLNIWPLDKLRMVKFSQKIRQA